MFVEAVFGEGVILQPRGALERRLDRRPGRDDALSGGMGIGTAVRHRRCPRRADQTGIAYSTDPVSLDGGARFPVLPRRPGRSIGGSSIPAAADTDTGGVFLIYNGADDRLVYRTGWALFDRDDPTRLLARWTGPVRAGHEWEKVERSPTSCLSGNGGRARRGLAVLRRRGQVRRRPSCEAPATTRQTVSARRWPEWGRTGIDRWRRRPKAGPR